MPPAPSGGEDFVRAETSAVGKCHPWGAEKQPPAYYTRARGRPGFLGSVRRGERRLVIADGAEEGLGNPLAVGAALEQLRFLRVGEERDLGEDARHRGADEHHERRLFDAEVLDGLVGPVQPLDHRVLHERGEVARLVELVVERDGLDEVGQRAHRLARRGVLAGGHGGGAQVVREIQEVGFDAARLIVGAGVGVNREKQIGALAVGDRRPFLKRHELVCGARENHLDPVHLFEQLLKAQRDVEDQLRFGHALALRTGIVAAVSGIDHDPRYTEPELSRH